jgi:hypothetical protein
MRHATTATTPKANESRSAESAGIQDGKVPDFRLQKPDEGGWQVRVVSDRGSYWLRANHVELCDHGKRLDLSDANAFLRAARKDGFNTEYVGPNGSAFI